MRYRARSFKAVNDRRSGSGSLSPKQISLAVQHPTRIRELTGTSGQLTPGLSKHARRAGQQRRDIGRKVVNRQRKVSACSKEAKF